MPEQTYDYLIAPKASFDATADAIRAKTCSQDSITWGQDGFASAIEEIDNIYKLLTNTLTTYESDQTVAIKYGTFQSCTSLISASFPNMVEDVKNNCFYNCTNLESINVRKASYIRQGGIRNTKIQSLVVTTVCGFEAQSVAYNTSLQAIDILGRPSGGTIEGGAFQNNTNLNILVIRRTSNVAQLNHINALASTKFADGGAGGTLYVPSSLIASYQSATNWSTILAYTNNQIKSIESTHTDPTAPIDLTLYYIDGTEIPTT